MTDAKNRCLALYQLRDSARKAFRGLHRNPRLLLGRSFLNAAIGGKIANTNGVHTFDQLTTIAKLNELVQAM